MCLNLHVYVYTYHIIYKPMWNNCFSFHNSTGDVALLNCTSIVNTSNESLNDKNPVSDSIHQLAGPELRDELLKLKGRVVGKKLERWASTPKKSLICHLVFGRVNIISKRTNFFISKAFNHIMALVSGGRCSVVMEMVYLLSCDLIYFIIYFSTYF